MGLELGGRSLLSDRHRGRCPPVHQRGAHQVAELERLRVLDPIVAASTEPAELVYRDDRTGGRIAAHPIRLGGAYRARFGAPYCGLHRADLQRALGAGVDRERLRLGRRLVDLSEHADTVTLSFADGGTVEADGVIAADGVRSAVRRFVAGDDGLLYSRTSGFRGIIPVGKLPSLPDPQAIQFWMGPSAHLLHYAIGADGGHVNFLAVVEGPRDWPDRERDSQRRTTRRRSPCFKAGIRPLPR